ncbi:MAG: tape measure protein, partial [Gammaproteobacteria bacterium]|nr:tape measure protein [Gammaproteobacteria bacterium]
KVGVEFIVEKLGPFLANLKKANKGLLELKTGAEKLRSSLESVRPKAGLLERAFVSLGEKIKSFAQNILQRILVIALGVLVRDAIRKVIDVIGGMIRTVVEATNTFQALEVRLNTFNMNTLLESGMAVNEAMERTIALTKEQLGSTLKLAVSSPYDATDVATGYSLARSYGFVDAKARELTDAVLNFSSAMGLDNVAIERIITNFGQMVQQGKITGTELRDLARGSFVPVNKILDMVAKNIGVTTEELDKMRKAGTTDPQWFIDAFIQLAETDFAGAAERMSRTLPKALGNLKDLFVGLPALNAIKPMFDAIGGGIADLVDMFGGKTVRFERLEAVFKRIGRALADIVNGIIGLMPSAESVADSIIGYFENIATWLQTNRGSIVDWVKNAIDFLKRLGETIKNDVIPVIQTFIKWVSDNKEEILKWGGIIFKAWLATQLLNIALRLVIGILIKAVSWLIKTVVAYIGFKNALMISKFVLGLFGISLGSVLTVILLTVAGITWLKNMVDRATKAWKDFKLVIDAVGVYLSNADWYVNGRNLTAGLIKGIYDMAPKLFDTVAWLAKTAIKIFNAIFGMHSPSKVMFDAGQNISRGLANGIKQGGLAAVTAAKVIAGQVAGVLGMGKTNFGQNLAGQFLGKNNEVMRGELTKGEKEDPCATGISECITDPIVGAIEGLGIDWDAWAGGGLGIAGKLKEAAKTAGAAMDDFYGRLKAYGTLPASASLTVTEYYSSLKDIGDLREPVVLDDYYQRLKYFGDLPGLQENQIPENDDFYNRLKEIGGLPAVNVTSIAKSLETTAYLPTLNVATLTTDMAKMANLAPTNISDISTTLGLITTRTLGDLPKIDSNIKSISTTGVGSLPALYAWLLLVINAGNKIQAEADGAGFGAQFGSTVPTQGRTYNSNVRNVSVTNNFNHMQKGQSVTMDYENMQFWV